MPQMLPSYWFILFTLVSVIYLMVVCCMTSLVIPFLSPALTTEKSSSLGSKNWL